MLGIFPGGTMLVVFTVAIAQSYRIRHCHLPAMRMPFRGFLLESSSSGVGNFMCTTGTSASTATYTVILGPFYGCVESN
ncbi:hypothetical protein V6N13_114989 [Hibiscus sabdariffa]